MFKNIKLGTKLLVVFLAVGIIPFAAIGTIALLKSSDAISGQAFRQLESMREVKQTQIGNLFTGIEGNMNVLLETVKTLRREAFEKLRSVELIKKKQIESYFDRVYKDVEVLAGSEDAYNVFKFLRQYEIDEEIEPDEPFLIDTYEYEEIWKERGKTLHDYVAVFGYSDAFIISADNGHVMYAAAKNPDIGANLKSGQYKDEGLALVWRRVIESKSVQIQDFRPYAPAKGVPFAFIGAPILDLGGELQAVAVLQIPLKSLNEIMQEREGLGKTGETYLVGDDTLMRSDSFLDSEFHSVAASFADTDKGKVDTVASREALAGKTGTNVIQAYNGKPVLSAYAPLDIKGLNWAIIAEIDVAEAFSPVDREGIEYFANFAEKNGYLDLFLMNPNGYCFYSMGKKADFQTNLVDGEFAESGLGRLVRGVLETHQFGFADFEPYTPRDGEPAAFIAQPLVNDDKLELVVALQVSPESINSIMTQRAGMGETGETYLVGPDKLMRSDSFLDSTNHSVMASFADPSKGSVDTEAVRQALTGKTGQEITKNYNGDSVLSAYAPVKIGNVTWAMIAEIAKAEAFAVVDMMKLLIGIVGIVGIIAIMFTAILVARSITRPINRIVDGLNEGAGQMASASGQVSSSSQQLAEGASEQAASIEETSSSLEEMSSMTKQNTENALQADSLMKEANQVVGEANNSMNELTTSMADISKASEETSKIIKTIDEIAFQTNLLALNAAVEAARAGEAGAGFAVVADEVRNLAMRAAEAAKNTADLIEGTVKKVKNGSELVTKTNEAFLQVADSSSKVGELVGEIAAASTEQAQGIEQVNKAVAEMDKVVQQNAANAEESSSASEEMNARAVQMKEMIGELVSLIGGSRKGTEKSVGHREYNPTKKKTLPRKTSEEESSKDVAIHQAREIDAEKLIPMEDDFKDF